MKAVQTSTHGTHRVQCGGDLSPSKPPSLPRCVCHLPHGGHSSDYRSASGENQSSGFDFHLGLMQPDSDRSGPAKVVAPKTGEGLGGNTAVAPARSLIRPTIHSALRGGRHGGTCRCHKPPFLANGFFETSSAPTKRNRILCRFF